MNTKITVTIGDGGGNLSTLGLGKEEVRESWRKLYIESCVLHVL